MSRRARQYARLFTKGGRRVTLQRRVANQPVQVIATNVRARIRQATDEEIAGGIRSTQRKVLILAEDIPVQVRPLQNGDQILVDGLTLTFDARPDDQTHRDGETLLAIGGTVTGA